MSIKTLKKRAERLINLLAPPPRIIHCGAAKEELLAQLEAQIQRDKEMGTAEDSTWTPEDEAIARQLDILLEQSVRDLETYNIKLVD